MLIGHQALNCKIARDLSGREAWFEFVLLQTFSLLICRSCCYCGNLQASSLLRSRSGRSHVTLPAPTRLFQTDIHSFPIVCDILLGPISTLLLYTLHQSHHSLGSWCFLSREKPLPLATCYGRNLQWKSRESTKCYICSFISLSKNKVYIFGKTSADLAGIIRLSLKIDVNKLLWGQQIVCLSRVFSAVDEVRKGSE